MKAYLLLGRNDVSQISVPAGTAVEIVVPWGCRWVPQADGSVMVLPTWWRRLLMRLGI